MMSGYLLVLLTGAIAGIADGQFDPLPPPPQKNPLGPAGVSSFSQVHPVPDFSSGLTAYCDLSYPQVFQDPTIISASQPMPVSLSVNKLLLDSPSAKAYREGLMAKKRAQGTRRLNNPTTGSEVPLTFLAPTAKINICNINRKFIFSVNNTGDTCYTFQEESIEYADCHSTTADVPNAFPDVSRWYCIPDSYRDVTFMVICPDTADPNNMFRWHTVNVPMNCCGRRHICDFKPYQSLNGPQRFPSS